MHHPEVEAGRGLHLVDHIGVVLGADAGELDLDAVLTDRPEHWFGDAQAVDAGADDLDRLLQLFLALVGVEVLAGGLNRLEREGHAALEVEAELEPAAGEAQQLRQQDVVALLDVPQRLLEADVREVLGEIQPALPAELLEGDELAGRLQRLLPGGRFLEQFAELGGLGGGVRADVVDEGLVLQGQELGARPGQHGHGQDQLPQIAFEHGAFGLKRGTDPAGRAGRSGTGRAPGGVT